MILNVIKKLFPAILLGMDTICFYLIYYLITILRTGSPGNFFGANRVRTWWSLGLPWSLPSVFTGLRIAAGLAVIGAIVGEFVGAFGGDRAPLGAIITSALKQNQTPTVFAAVALAAMLGFVLFGVVNLVGWLLLGRWHESAR